jgi:hypothetical protein
MQAWLKGLMTKAGVNLNYSSEVLSMFDHCPDDAWNPPPLRNANHPDGKTSASTKETGCERVEESANPRHPFCRTRMCEGFVPSNRWTTNGRPNYNDIESAAKLAMSGGHGEESLRVWSNLVEAQPGEVRVLRDLGYTALSLGYASEAFDLFLKAADKRPWEPQNYQALADAASTMGRTHLADFFFELVQAGSWDERFGPVKQINAVKYLLHLTDPQQGVHFGTPSDHRQEHLPLDTEKQNTKSNSNDLTQMRRSRMSDMKRLSELPDKVDLLTIVSWNTDDSDVDLHVKDPLGEECYFRNPRTKLGGWLTQDVVQGYGPEMFVLPDAKAPGKYEIFVLHYSEPRTEHEIPSKVLATVVQNWQIGADQQNDEVPKPVTGSRLQMLLARTLTASHPVSNVYTATAPAGVPTTEDQMPRPVLPTEVDGGVPVGSPSWMTFLRRSPASEPNSEHLATSERLTNDDGNSGHEAVGMAPPGYYAPQSSRPRMAPRSDTLGMPQVFSFSTASIPESEGTLFGATLSGSYEAAPDAGRLLLLLDVVPQSLQIAVLNGKYAVPVIPRNSLIPARRSKLFIVNTTEATRMIQRISTGEVSSDMWDAQAFNVTLLKGERHTSDGNLFAASVVVSYRQLSDAMNYFMECRSTHESDSPDAQRPNSIIEFSSARLEVTVGVDENGVESIQVALFPPSTKSSPFADPASASNAGQTEPATPECSRPRQLGQATAKQFNADAEQDSDQGELEGRQRLMHLVNIRLWLRHVARERLNRSRPRGPADACSVREGCSGEETRGDLVDLLLAALELPDCSSTSDAIVDSRCGPLLKAACSSATTDAPEDFVHQICTHLASNILRSDDGITPSTEHSGTGSLTWWL